MKGKLLSMIAIGLLAAAGLGCAAPNPAVPEVTPAAAEPTGTAESTSRPAATPASAAEPTRAAPTAAPTMQEVTPMPGPTTNPAESGANFLIDLAVDDLAARLNISREAIELVRFEEVTWPDGALGCPQPGMAYIQVLVDGAFIQLRADGNLYNYHSGGGRGPFLCEQSLTLKGTPAKLDELIPPPGGDLDK